MKETGSVAASILLGLVLSASLCAAGPFDKEFKIKNVVGSCTVTLPDGSSGAAEEGKAYPYGSRIATGRKSSAVMELSGGNEVRILANSTLIADQKADDASDKTVRLREGRIQVKLEENFHKTNKFKVETPTAVCGAIGCEFTATAAPTTCSFEVQEGKIVASGVGPYGGNWEAMMDSGDKIAVTTAGKTLTTIQNRGGEFFLRIKGVGTPVALTVGSKVNVTATQGVNAAGHPVIRLVVVVTNPDGTTQPPVETYIDLPPGTEPPPPPPPGEQPPPTLLGVQTTGTTPSPVGLGGGGQ
jgi:hypothetical protein